jgi:hypothetical protein
VCAVSQSLQTVRHDLEPHLELVAEVVAGTDRLDGDPGQVRVGVAVRGEHLGRDLPRLDLAARVVAVGEGMTRFRVGDDVFGIGEGSLAAYATARVDKLTRRPDCWTAAQAAAVPVSGR